MDRLLNRICSIDNHPISKLDYSFRIVYVKGLGSCLCMLSNCSKIVELFFNVWASSILKDTASNQNFWVIDKGAIQKALSTQRKGFHFFSMKYELLFDTYYLMQSSNPQGYSQEISDRCYNLLRGNVCGFFTKGALTKVHDYFSNNITCKKLSKELIDHRQINEIHFQHKEKRILVVANVSAGKSTLINALTGYRINHTKTTACTKRLAFIHNKLSKDGITAKSENGKYHYYDDIESINTDNYFEVAFPFNSTLSNDSICLIDTPGYNNSVENNHKTIIEKALQKKHYDFVIYVSNCKYFGTTDEYRLLTLLKENVNKPIIFVLNQLDYFVPDEDSIDKMIQDFKVDLVKLGYKKPIIVPISAFTSFLAKMDPSKMNTSETIKNKSIQELFQNTYYDLPAYIHKRRSNTLLEKAGIINLEEVIKSLI